MKLGESLFYAAMVLNMFSFWAACFSVRFPRTRPWSYPLNFLAFWLYIMHLQWGTPFMTTVPWDLTTLLLQNQIAKFVSEKKMLAP